MPANGPRHQARTRAAQAFKRRCMGQTWATIAEALDYRTPASAYNAVKDHIRRLPPDDQATARALSSASYEAVKEQLWQNVAAAKTAGDRNATTAALRAVADVQDRHDRLLGIAAPAGVEVNVNVSAVDVIEEARARLHAAIEADRPRGVQIVDGEVVDYGSVKHRRELEA